MLATFYSFKGGVGRSMAMANVAEILAGWGYRVVVCDWDLEAPGIERYVFDRPEELEDARRGTGIVDLISEYKAAIAAPPPAEDAPSPGDGHVRLGNLWIRRPQSCCLTVPTACRSGGGWVGLLPSGRRHNPEALAKYSETVRGFDWNDFCQNWGGGAYLEFFRNDLGGAERFADFILVDSRTGLTEVGGVCTHFLADAVVLCCAGNEQNIEGTRDMARMLSRETLVAERGGRALAVLPVASRIERSSEIEYLVKFEQQFLAEFAKFIPPEVAEKMGGAEGFIQSSLIPYIPKYSFSETLVARKPPGERHRELYSAYEAIARSLVHWGAARCGIDDAVLRDPASQSPQPVRIARTSSIVPRGRYYLAAHSADAEAARMLADELRRAGLDLWWDDSERTNSRGVARLSVAREAAGMLLLAPQKPDRDWLDSELNRTLALQAARPAFRPLLLLPPGVPPTDLLQAQRFRRLQLPADAPHSVAARIFAELLPEPVLPPESPDLEVLGTLVSPVESHARFCIGREEELSRIVAELDVQLERGAVAEVIISGSAASGKTALVRGGLIPLFRAGSIGPGAASWQTAYVRIASEEPLAAVARTLAAATGCTLRGSTHMEQFDELRAHLSAGTQPVALILDKVEDIPIRHGFDDTRTSECYNALLKLGSAAKAGFALIVCIRARHLGELARIFPDLARHTVSLEIPTSTIMRTMIEGGARLFGQRLEAGLVDRIIGDIARVRENSRLPGLVLRKLIENRENDTLTHAAYKAFGGIEEIFVSDAAFSLTELDPERQRLAACLITAVVDPRTRRPRTLPVEEVLARAARVLTVGGPEQRRRQAEETLATLVGWHLFYIEGDNIALATEAVARIPQVSQWIEENRVQLQTQEMLDQLARIWGETGHGADFARGLDLKVFTALGPQSGVAAELLSAAQEAQADETAKAAESVRMLARQEARAAQASQEARNLKRVLAVMAALVLGTLFIILFAAYQLSKTKRDLAVAEVKVEQARAQVMETLAEREREGTALSANRMEREKLIQQLSTSADNLTESLRKEQAESAKLRNENESLNVKLAELQKRLPGLPVPAPVPAPVPPSGQQAAPKPRIFFEVPNSALRDLARGLTTFLAAEGFSVDPQIGSGGSGRESEVKYYFAEDKAVADRLIELLQGMGVSNLRDAASLVKPLRDARPGHFDVTLASGASPSPEANTAKRAGETGWLFAGNYDAKSGEWKRRNLNGLVGLPEKDTVYSSSLSVQLRTAAPKVQGQLPPKKGAAFPPDWRFRVLTVWPRPGDDAVWCEVVAEAPAPPSPQP